MVPIGRRPGEIGGRAAPESMLEERPRSRETRGSPRA